MRAGARIPHPDRSLPTLPVVVARLVALFATQDYRIEDVVRVLEHDPPISSRVLRLANSAYYGLPRRVDRLHRAVTLLGSATVQALCLASAVLEVWGNAPPEAVRELWTHAYLTGEGARFLARRTPPASGGVHPDALFVAGLFHDLGKIGFLDADPEGYLKILSEAQDGGDLRDGERALYGWDHAEAGAALLDHWNLPGPIVALVRHHHEGDLRAELRGSLDLLRWAHAVVRGTEPPLEAPFGASLVDDLKAFLEKQKPQAEAFYNALADT